MKPGERRLLEITGRRVLTSRDFPSPGRGPNGRKLCCWCHGTEIPPRAQRFCGPVCRREYTTLVWISERNPYIHARDGFTCQLCGTLLMPWWSLRRALWMVRWDGPIDRDDDGFQSLIHQCAAIADELGWPTQDEPYQIDHILPIIDGGSNHPSNLRTLCPACHAAVTARQASERAAARRGDRAELGVRQQHLLLEA